MRYLKSCVVALAPMLCCVLTTVTYAGNFANIRVDHQVPPYRPYRCDIALWQPDTSPPTVYVAFERYIVDIASDIMFQKSTDGGRTWLPEDIVIEHTDVGIGVPRIGVDGAGRVFIFFWEKMTDFGSYIWCVRSLDHGSTWSPPVRVDDDTSDYTTARHVSIAFDTAGALVCTWHDNRTDSMEIWCSVSTDHGETWRENTRVTYNTGLQLGHSDPDLCVQPGTDDYLIAAETEYDQPLDCVWPFLYRSTDGGLTWDGGVRFDSMVEQLPPSVIADRTHVICASTSEPNNSSRFSTYTRTLTSPDSWGPTAKVLDKTDLSSYDCPEMAMTPDGRVHLVQMVRNNLRSQTYDIRYFASSDFGATWADQEIVNTDTAISCHHCCPKIAAGPDGSLCMVWYHTVLGPPRSQIWFATNRALGVAENRAAAPVCATGGESIISNGVLNLPEFRVPSGPPEAILVDISGRIVAVLQSGPNDVSRVTTGVYFIAYSGNTLAHKVVILN